MGWLKRGLCGMDLKRHTYVVAGMDMILSVGTMVMGFVVILIPEKYLSVEQPAVLKINMTDTLLAVLDANETEIYEKNSSAEMFHYNARIEDLQDNGVEAVIGAAITVITTSMLIFGAMKNKTIYFVPWLAQNITGLALGVGVALVRLLTGTATSVAGTIICLLLIIPCYCYLVFGVASLYMILCRMKRHSKEIISSVMQAPNGYQDGINFQRLHEEIGRELKTMPPNGLRTNYDNRGDAVYFSL